MEWSLFVSHMLLQDGVRAEVARVEAQIRATTEASAVPQMSDGEAGGLFLSIVFKACLDVNNDGFVKVCVFESMRGVEKGRDSGLPAGLRSAAWTGCLQLYLNICRREHYAFVSMTVTITAY